MEEFWKIAVGIAGLGAIAAFAFWSLYRGWLKLGIFANLTPEQTYKLMWGFLILTFLFCCVALWAYLQTRPPPSRVVHAVLRYNDKPVDGEFTLTPIVPGVDLGPRRSDNGEVKFELPKDINQIPSLTLSMAGFELRDDPPYKIEDSFLRINVIPNGLIPRTGPEEKPSPNVFQDLPKREAVNISATVKPGDYTLEYRNATDKPLRLLILDVCRYYDAIEHSKPGRAYWLDFPFNPRADFEGYDHFDRTDGTHCFAVMDNDRKIYPLAPSSVKNVCEKQVTKLTVTSSAPGKFEGKWE